MSAREFLQVEFPKEHIGQEEKLEIFLPLAASELFRAHATNAKLLTKGEDVKRAYEITISTENIDYKFEPGDTIGIFPLNDQEEIGEILSILQLDDVADLSYRLSVSPNCKKKNATIPKHLPKTGTVRNLLTKCLDLHIPPKKAFLKILAESATSETDREKLNHICSQNGSEAYLNLIKNEGGSLLDLLKAFPSCKCSITDLLEHLPPMKPRPYSISSSPLLLNELKITFSVVYHENGEIGLCSGYLERIAKNCPTAINFYFRKPTKFRLPVNKTSPLIMIGPGTGVSPFIGFLQHLHLENINEGRNFLRKTWLFFGCRYSDRDYIYSNKMDIFTRAGVLLEKNVSFSREGKQKRYVQHDVEERGAEFFKWISDDGAVIYVCGDGKSMARDVKKSVVEVFVKFGKKTVEEAEGFLKELESDGRYIEDVWC